MRLVVVVARRVVDVEGAVVDGAAVVGSVVAGWVDDGAVVAVVELASVVAVVATVAGAAVVVAFFTGPFLATVVCGTTTIMSSTYFTWFTTTSLVAVATAWAR